MHGCRTVKNYEVMLQDQVHHMEQTHMLPYSKIIVPPCTLLKWYKSGLIHLRTKCLLFPPQTPDLNISDPLWDSAELKLTNIQYITSSFVTQQNWKSSSWCMVQIPHHKPLRTGMTAFQEELKANCGPVPHYILDINIQCCISVSYILLNTCTWINELRTVMLPDECRAWQNEHSYILFCM